METASFDLDALIANINADKPRGGDRTKYLNKVLMNTKDNQGTLTWIPIYSSTFKNFYVKLEGVREFEAKTTLIDKGHGWYRILPLSFYDDLNEEELELYNEVVSYYDTLKDNDSCDRDELRTRRYTILFGMCSKLVNKDGKGIDDYKDCACIFVYPSLDPVAALGTAINTQVAAMGSKDWITFILSPNTTGRQGVILVTYTKAEGPGYDCSMSMNINNPSLGPAGQFIDPKYEIDEDKVKFFDDPLPTFLGWIYNQDEHRFFNPRAFKELRDVLKQRLIEEGLMNAEENTDEMQPADSKVTYENKNNLSDAAQVPNTPAAEAPKKKLPF